MGQQQILLLTLVTIVVGIATIVAIDTMQESQQSSNLDAIQQDIILIINEAQGYYYRHETMDGGGRSFDEIQPLDISIGDSTKNGTYSLTGNGNTLVVEGTGIYDNVFLRAVAEFQDSQLEVSWDYNK